MPDLSSDIVRIAAALPNGDPTRRALLEVLAVELPSEGQGGKPAHDEDFKAGYKAGEEALSHKSDLSLLDAQKAYRRVSRKHGMSWVQGFGAAIDVSRGAINMPGPQIARRLGLVKTGSTEHEASYDTWAGVDTRSIAKRVASWWDDMEALLKEYWSNQPTQTKRSRNKIVFETDFFGPMRVTIAGTPAQARVSVNSQDKTFGADNTLFDILMWIDETGRNRAWR